MIPPFNADGYLPPGLHTATLDEIEERFGRESELRRAEMESIRWLYDLARRAGVTRFVINGSFVTDKFEPNDADCVLLTDDNYRGDPEAQAELEVGLPFIELALVDADEFAILVGGLFATDREGTPKGLVEVIL